MKNIPNKQTEKKKIVYKIPYEALPIFFKDQGFSDEQIKKLMSTAKKDE